MNKAVEPNQIALHLQDAPQIAEVAVRQLLCDRERVTRSVPDLLLHKPFALGYAIGFAEQACRRAGEGRDGDNSTVYLRTAIGTMLGDTNVAASFLSFAASQQGNRDFEGGYDAGAQDMDAWFFSFGEHIPDGLSRYLDKE